MSFIRVALLFLAGSAIFSLVCCQAPLYYSNQNQYFLHGLAAAGEGHLDEDWLANTSDPTPVFSGLVTVTVRYLRPWVFHVYYGLIFGAYGAAMFGLFVAVAGKDRASRRWPVFVILFLCVHCALARWASYRWLGNDYPWYFQAGVAGQYILGAMFQPSTFGVFLVVAVCFFVHDRPFLAGFCVAVAATVHSTYLAASAMLTLGFLVALVVEGRRRQALALGAWTLALVLPVCIYVYMAFRPDSAAAFAEANDIVANFRLPHHSRPQIWFDTIAGVQTAGLVLAILLVFRTRLFWVLVVPTLIATLLTLGQVVIGSDTFALLFPWRASAVLVPIATTVILSRLALLFSGKPCSPLAPREDSHPFTPREGYKSRMHVVCIVLALGLAAAGVWIMAEGQGYHSNDDELKMMQYVRENCQSNDVYLIPVRVSKLPKGIVIARSSDFEPWQKKRSDPGVIPQEMQRFRLTTGAPIFVDFKSIPYRDVDVLEWRRRIGVAEAIQSDLKAGKLAQAIAAMRANGITHLVRPATEKYWYGNLVGVFTGPHYRVYHIR